MIVSNGQSTFSKNIDINGFSDIGVSVNPHMEGYVLTASSICFNGQLECYAIVFCNEEGEVTSVKEYNSFPLNLKPGNFEGNAGAMIGQHGDLYFSGTKRADISTADIFLMKTDEFGDSIWMKTYPRPFGDISYSLLPYTDSTIMLYSEQSALQENDQIWLLEVDLNGNVVWEGLFGQAFNSVARQDIIKLENGDLVFSYLTCDGLLYCNMDYPYSMTVTRINANKEEVWTNTFASYEGILGGTPNSEIVPLDDNGFLVSYMRDNLDGFYPRPPILIWLDADGNVIKQYDFPDFTELRIHNLLRTSSGAIVGVGLVDLLDYDLGFGGWIFSIDQAGELLWERYIVDLDHPALLSWFNSVTETVDGNFMATGTIRTAEGNDIWLVKLDSLGCLTSDCENSFQIVSYDDLSSNNNKPTFSVFPNPLTSNILNIKEGFPSIINRQGMKVKIFNAAGTLLYSDDYSEEIRLDASYRGILFVNIFDQGGQLLHSQKIVSFN